MRNIPFPTQFIPAFSLAMLAALFMSSVCRAEEIPVKTGEKIAFLGDSITQQGAGSPGGYVHLVISGLEANGIKATAIPAGISGHKSNDMLARVERDVIDKKPDWMTLSCGVNDVWHGAKGVPLEQYKKNITEIVDKVQAAHIKVMILTSTMIGEDQSNENNMKLVPYNKFLHELAKEKQCLIADLNAEMQSALKPTEGEVVEHKGNRLTADGVHMNPRGNQMMAMGILKAFGLTEDQLHKAHEYWLNMPNAAEVKVSLSLRQFEQLSKLAESEHKSVSEVVQEEISKKVGSSPAK